MALTSRTEVAQWCIIGVAGCSSLVCAVAVIYVIYVHAKSLGVPRSLLGICSTGLCGIQVLPALVALYGYSPKVMCGIYNCVAFGFLYPLVHWIVLCMLLHTLEKYDACIATLGARTVGKMDWRKSIVYSLPLMVGQSVVAWIGLAFEDTSVIVDYLISTSYPVPCADMSPGCKVCLFPGISVLMQGLFVIVYSVILYCTTARLARIVINVKLKKKVWLYCICSVGCMLVGFICMGTTVGVSPITGVADPLMWSFTAMWIATVLFLFALHCLIACCVWILHSLYETQLAKQSLRILEPDLMCSHSETSSRQGEDDVTKTPVVTRGRIQSDGILSTAPRSHSDHSVPKAKDVLLSPQELANVMSGTRPRRRWSSYGDGYALDRHVDYYDADEGQRGSTLPALSQNLYERFVQQE